MERTQDCACGQRAHAGRSLACRYPARLQAGHDDPSKIRLARTERNGEISIVPYHRTPRVVDVAVEGGALTAGIDLG